MIVINKKSYNNMFLILLMNLLISNCKPITECASEILITNKSLGEIVIGERIGSVKEKLPKAVESNEISEGIENRVLRFEDSCGYILFRFDGDYLTEIRTNSKKVYTNSNYKIGDKISDIISAGEKVVEYESLGGELLINISPSNVKFYLSKKDESKYFSEGGDFDVNLDPNFKLNEFVVRRPRP